ncbi:hypothetical protein niasHT_026911 [Heterodera trifolii]|uniref:Amidase domain-containing protein n=1 Tax=Heterodera trifolii TaxID=157864 RepID=A0ABD2JXW8_9BILA
MIIYSPDHRRLPQLLLRYKFAPLPNDCHFLPFPNCSFIPPKMVFRHGLRLLLLFCLAHAQSNDSQQSADCAEGEFCALNDADSSHFISHFHKPKNDSHGCKPFDLSRYYFMRSHYKLLRFLANCYFAVVDAVFELINWFQPMHVVGLENASELIYIPAHVAAEMIREGNLTSKELVTAYIDRLKEVNPLINAIAHENYKAALKLAKEVDTELAKMDSKKRKSLAFSKPFYGVPFTSKDNLKTKGFVTGAGNRYLKEGGKAATKDALIVKRMKDAGAILLAISTLPNLAMSYGCDDSVYGITNNPHDTRRIPGGSSSGEGALIGAGASLCGIGNDIGGSIRIPANMNGVFGLRPTSFPDHVVPTEGIVPESLFYKPALNMLSNGPLCRFASDLPLALAVMAGKKVNSFHLDMDFTKDFKLYYLEDLNVLISQELKPEQRFAVRRVKSYFESKHNLTVQKVEFTLLSRFLELFYADPWKARVPSFDELKTTYQDIQAGVSNNTLLAWEFEALKRFAVPKSEYEQKWVLLKKEKLRKQVAQLLGKNGLLLTPAWPTDVPFHHMEPFATFNLKYTMMVNVLGFPALTAPTSKSWVTGMPLGVQLIAAPFNEALLIAAAKELERGFGGWVKPGQIVPNM